MINKFSILKNNLRFGLSICLTMVLLASCDDVEKTKIDDTDSDTSVSVVEGIAPEDTSSENMNSDNTDTTISEDTTSFAESYDTTKGTTVTVTETKPATTTTVPATTGQATTTTKASTTTKSGWDNIVSGEITSSTVATTVPVTESTVATTTITFPDEGTLIESNSGYKFKAPNFLTYKQQKLFVNGAEFAHNAVAEGYKGTYSDKDIITKTVNGITSKYVPGNTDLFPTYEDFKDFVYSIYVDDLAENVLQREQYIDYNGKLYVATKKDSYSSDYLGQSFTAIAINDEQVVFSLTAYLGTSSDYSEKTITYYMTNTEDGWRFEQLPFWF